MVDLNFIYWFFNFVYFRLLNLENKSIITEIVTNFHRKSNWIFNGQAFISPNQIVTYTCGIAKQNAVCQSIRKHEITKIRCGGAT